MNWVRHIRPRSRRWLVRGLGWRRSRLHHGLVVLAGFFGSRRGAWLVGRPARARGVRRAGTLFRKTGAGFLNHNCFVPTISAAVLDRRGETKCPDQNHQKNQNGSDGASHGGPRCPPPLRFGVRKSLVGLRQRRRARRRFDLRRLDVVRTPAIGTKERSGRIEPPPLQSAAARTRERVRKHSPRRPEAA